MAIPVLSVGGSGGCPNIDGLTGSAIPFLRFAFLAGGWTEAFTATSTRAVFRSSTASGGLGYYVQVTDNGTPSAARFQWLTFETMSNLDTGTNVTPTVALQAAGTFNALKSNTLSATTRPAQMYVDPKRAILLIDSGSTAGDWFCYLVGEHIRSPAAHPRSSQSTRSGADPRALS